MLKDDNSFINEMVELFKIQVAEYSEEMPAMLKEGKYDILARIAHKAKSSVAVMGMVKEKELLEVIETNSKAGTELNSLESLIEAVIVNSKKAILELDEQLNNT
ncbi:Hpt domain-containing protein [Bacteroidota bacterium]